MSEIDWTNPPDPYLNPTNWAEDFHNWFVERTTSPQIPTYKELEFGSDIAWAAGQSSTYGLRLHRDHNEIIRIRGDVVFVGVGAAITRQSAIIPDEYAPRVSTSRTFLSPGWSWDVTAAITKPVIAAVVYDVDGWYLVSIGTFSGAQASGQRMLVDILYPHKEIF